MKEFEFDKDAVLNVLNKILELELAGVVRYTHYSLMVFGYNRIPIVKWLRDQASESLDHAHQAGELITLFEGHPSLGIGELLETHRHNIGDILRESLEHEKRSIILYRQLLELVKDKNIMLEEFARELIYIEELHLGDVDKMLRHIP
jgi:bacterioferritin